MNIVQAVWLENSYCEYCPSRVGKTYLPLTKDVVNPQHICEDCSKEHNIIDWFEEEKEYELALLFVNKE
jgi:hypothetical protein